MILSHRLRVANSQGPNIVTDGLTFHIDAANPNSFDPSTNSSSATDLVTGSIASSFWGNNVSYAGNTTNSSGSDPGHFTFANTGAYASNGAPFGIVFSNSMFDLANYPTYSFDCWFRLGANGNSNYNHICQFASNSGIGGYSYNPISQQAYAIHAIVNSGQNAGPARLVTATWYGSGNGTETTIDLTINTPSLGTNQTFIQDKWFHFAYSSNPNGWAYGGYRRHWIDGVRVNSTQYGSANYMSYTSRSGSDRLYIGGTEGVNSYRSRYRGDIARFRYYKSKLLSDAEVAQNWNQEKALFGR